jgi:hypothetical protein
MHRSVRYSILTIVAVLCLGVALSAAGLKLPAFSRGAGVIAQVRAVPMLASDDDSQKAISPGALLGREVVVQTDKPGYLPGEVVVITGSGWEPGEAVTLLLQEDPKFHGDRKVSVIADSFGAIFDNQFIQDAHEQDVTFRVTAIGKSSGLSTQAAFGHASADLDQCANGSLASPDSTPCQSGTEWVNGNLGGSKAHYAEGDSVPYRLRFGGLTAGSEHTVTIEWDTTKSDKHALDYIRTFNATVTTADPCAGVSGCGTFSQFDITKDPQVDSGSGSPITQLPGKFTLYGGTITALSAYSYPTGPGFTGDKSAQITITFTTNVTSPVLAWAGHISTRINWGTGSSCVAISGSPFHTRLIALDGSGGNQDRSLSSDAVIFPGSITITKQASPEGSTSFPFTASSAPLTNFNLVDNGTSTNVKVFSLITDADFKTYTVSESVVANWSLDSVACSVSSPNGGSTTISSNTVTINLKEGEDRSCTFSNSAIAPKLTVTKVVSDNTGGNKQVADFPLLVDSTSVSSGVKNAFSTGAHVVSESQQTGYELVGITGDCAANGSITLALGDDKSCTITNRPIAPKLTVTKVITDNTGGNKQVANFPLFVDTTGVTSGTQNTFALGAHVVSETQQTGYSLVSISGDCAANGNITLNPGDVKACTITNTPIAPKLTVTKVVTNNTHGTKQVVVFPLFEDTTGVTSGTQNTFALGAHVVSETQQTGYSLVSISGDCAANGNITLNPGDVKACTITNTPIAPTLTVTKVVHNNHGGGKGVADFPLFVNATGVTSGAQNTFALGPYVVSETQQTGYTQDSISGDCDANGNVTLSPGDVKSCTITNSDSKNTPSVATSMKWVLRDDVTVSGLRPGAPDASDAYVIFTLYGPFGQNDVASCDGAPIFTSLQADGALAYDQPGTSGTASTSGFEVTGPGIYLWKAHYSGDQNNNARDTDCGSEKTEIKDLSPSN